MIAHEWFTVIGGSDKTFLALAELFPEAELVTAVADPEALERHLPGRAVTRLVTDRLPGARHHWRRLAPAVMAAWAAYRPEADLLVTSSHFAATAAGWRFGGRHVAYCHTPLRLAWRPDLEHGRLPGISEAVTSRAIAPLLRTWDRAASRSVDEFVANSTAVADRIARAYGREATVIHPPVDIEPFLRAERTPGDHLLAFGRLVPYKRFDLAVSAAARLGLPLVVAGDGPEADRLRAAAGPGVTFLGRVSDEEYIALLAGARALLFAGEEDFGLVPVEALAAGCPVVAYAAGGALDTVRPGLTGELFDEQTPGSLASAVERCLDRAWDPEALRHAALPYCTARFLRDFAFHVGVPVPATAAPRPARA
ncbi:MAG: glycosyltransferase [Acidimicrobiia bacterium]|nr:glycosyltransferase [Acidimicrobiia bacterium]